jgi:hypothetical protein
MTPQELNAARDFVDRAKDDGYRVVVVPQNIRRKLKGAVDITRRTDRRPGPLQVDVERELRVHIHVG